MKLVKRQNRASHHRNAVVFACDHGHFPLAMFAAERIRRVEDGPFDIVIAMPDIAKVTPAQMDGPVRICEIDISALPTVPMVKDWISFGTYYRWVLPSVFRDEYETLFYLDTDTYLRRPGIQDLFEGIDRPVPLAAVTELSRLIDPALTQTGRFEAKVRDLGGRNGEYYNAGVLVYQPEAFLAMDGLRRFQEAMAKNVEFLPIHRDQDQGAMNLAFADDILPLNPLLNWRSRDWMNPRIVERFDPVVLHFAGPSKPWDKQDNPFLRLFEAEYADYLEREFPEFKRKVPEGSAAWRYENPKHGLRIMEDIRVGLYRRRVRKKFEGFWYRDYEGKCRNMQRTIEAAVVG
ncbi:glycosyltransferase [Mangrovicoccus algicola]|uniref:Glycosyltransferase family 8 protein n=1 Tax=Mangrovicoccus algicola TaxID=2771008 RepID=A0A8J6Z6G9_9RHOB|nr:glycosyltransferase [Mangrovicoccus algicola]MBE3638709.1 hypothetical protein [Mangrovicoccus algicola]